MQRERLTPERIRRFTCPEGMKQAFLWDTVAPRLSVRATAGGKAFVFESKLNRRTIRVTIGDVRAWNLDDARAEARRLQTLVDQGIDPRQEKAERIAAAEAKREESQRAAAPALVAWNAYMEARRPKWGERSYADHLAVSKPGGEVITRGRKASPDGKTLPGALHGLLARPLNGIDAAAVRDWLKSEAERRPTHAALAFRLLRAFLNWCADRSEYQSLIHADACASRRVRDELPKRQAKQDALEREMLRPWFEQVRAIANPVQSAYLQVVLLTGARREEVAEMRWEDVDFRWRKIIIRDKVEGERTIPLTPHVAALLAALPRRNQWVFSSPAAASGRLQEPRIAHNRALRDAGLPPLTIHGLRRSFGSLSEWCEVPAGIVAQIQGHKPSATAEKHYRVRPIDLLRQWHERIEAWMLAEAGIEQPKQEEVAPALRVVG